VTDDQDDARRFTELYDTYQARVFAYAVSRVGRQLADDVVGDTFLVAWRKFAKIPPSPLPWLLAVARNVLRERYRDEVRQAALATEMRAWADEVSGDVADAVTERSAVLAALGRLDDADRELLTLVAWHNLTTRQAAQVVGCSTATYFVRLHRARRRLAEALADPPHPAPAARALPSASPAEEYSR
jgi:RNA polymerase sigma-70 factor (ECF subfamily)